MIKKNLYLTWFLIVFIGVMLFFAFELLNSSFNNKVIDYKKINEQVSLSTKLLPGFIPDQIDDYWDIKFPAPSDWITDRREIARINGLYRVYTSADTRRIDPESVISISFSKRKPGLSDLGNYILGFKLNLDLFFSGQKMTSARLRLPKDVVQKFEDMRVSYLAIRFFVDKGTKNNGYNCTVFFFGTPAGFWVINWTAPRKTLERADRERNVFLSLIKYMMIGIGVPSLKTYIIHM